MWEHFIQLTQEKMLIRKGGLGAERDGGERGEKGQRMIKQLTNGADIYKW